MTGVAFWAARSCRNLVETMAGPGRSYMHRKLTFSRSFKMMMAASSVVEEEINGEMILMSVSSCDLRHVTCTLEM